MSSKISFARNPNCFVLFTIARVKVPGFTENELKVICERWRLVISGRKEYREETKAESKEEIPITHTEKMNIFKTAKLPLEAKPRA